MNDTYEDRLDFWRQQYTRFLPVEPMYAPMRSDQEPRRYWKKSQKKIRRERRQRGGRK